MIFLTFSLELYLLYCVSCVCCIAIKLKSMIKNKWPICWCGTHGVQCQHGVSSGVRRTWTRPSLQDRSCSSLCFTFCSPPPSHLHFLLSLCWVVQQTTFRCTVSQDPNKVNEYLKYPQSCLIVTHPHTHFTWHCPSVYALELNLFKKICAYSREFITITFTILDAVSHIH